MSGILRSPLVALLRQRSSMTAWLVAAAGLGAVSTAAQTTRVRDLEELIVTGQKRGERLQDVPVSVSAIDAGSLAESSQVRLQDYYSKIPGLGLELIGDGS